MKHYYTLTSILIGVSIVLVNSQVALSLSMQEIEQIAREITVQIVDNQNSSISGSGVIIKHSGKIYTVLTTYHVVKDGKKQIFTSDKQSNQIKSMKPLKGSNGSDLAIVEFSSNNNYKIARIGNSDQATASTTVYVAGFPAQRGSITNPDLFLNRGQVNANGAAQREGYNLIYDNDTLEGMSGGAVLNEQGELVGVHGRSDKQELGDKSQTKIITGIGITIYSALQQMLAVGIDLGVRPSSTNVAAAPKADDFFIKAKQNYDNQDYKGAVANYTEAIRLNPNYAEAYNDRGAVRFLLGDKQGAAADFTSAIKISPNYAQAYNNRGTIRADYLRDKQGAVADFNQALNINPDYAEAYNRRGLTRATLGDKQGAITDYNQALKINPNDAQVYNNRGVARNDLGDKQGAITDYNQALKINPNEPNVHYNRGFALLQLGNTEGAIADFNQAIKINPNDAEAYNGRGRCRFKLGDIQGAIGDLTLAIKINPNYADAYYNRGFARPDVVDLQKAADLYLEQGKIAEYQTALKRIRRVQQ
ncbi:MAG: serine protease [Desmonostoc vinosum HA7617-LM4]|jgi:tetratricopeptide (TPR) repeat protein|nr:serine protease [Desmonostoc vinosum HA7617-LM4]